MYLSLKNYNCTHLKKRINKFVKPTFPLASLPSTLSSAVQSLPQKREALLGLITAVDVFMIDPQTHWLEIQFHIPLVGDELVYKDPKNKKLGYAIRNGQESFMVQLGQKSHSKKNYSRYGFQ
jgi:hypothetical protein